MRSSTPAGYARADVITSTSAPTSTPPRASAAATGRRSCWRSTRRAWPNRDIGSSSPPIACGSRSGFPRSSSRRAGMDPTGVVCGTEPALASTRIVGTQGIWLTRGCLASAACAVHASQPARTRPAVLEILRSDSSRGRADRAGQQADPCTRCSPTATTWSRVRGLRRAALGGAAPSRRVRRTWRTRCPHAGRPFR